MRREDMAASLRAAYGEPAPRAPVVHLLVPENDLKQLVQAARNAVFDVDEQALKPSELRVMLELDSASEPFADMMDLDESAMAGRSELRQAAERVRTWLDGGCTAQCPVRHVRAIVEALI